MNGGPLLELSTVSKRFGAVEALADVSLALYPGEVVALVGDNGAGKSTLVKLVTGVTPADSGELRWQGRRVAIRQPRDAQALGIVAVYQDLALCDNLDVVANLFLGAEESSGGLLDAAAMDRRARDLLGALPVQLPDLHTSVASLSGGQRQAVAIARALLGNPRLVILDEPTAALGVAQTAHVLDLIERMRDQRLAVLLITHNLADVRAIADRAVVLRMGRNAGDYSVADTGQQEIVAAILGASSVLGARHARRPVTRTPVP